MPVHSVPLLLLLTQFAGATTPASIPSVRHWVVARPSAATEVPALAQGAGSVTISKERWGRKPPMGWRGWQQFGLNSNESNFRAGAKMLVDRSRKVDGVPTSLFDLGYNWIGQDDGWQECNSGPGNVGWHNSDGSPNLNKTKFPDLPGAVKFAHSLNLSVAWYLNNCKCADHNSDPKFFQGDVNFVLEHNMDGVKIDGCGGEKNIDLFHSLFNSPGGSRGHSDFYIENCHDNGHVAPNASYCPYTAWRHSYDYNGMLFDTGVYILNMNAGNNANDSRPYCWAYLQMLMVGVDQLDQPTPSTQTPLNPIETRSHFGMWCIVSSPLYLSFSPFDQLNIDKIWPLITNTEAIAVDQQWSGDPGSLLKSSNNKTAPFYPFQPNINGTAPAGSKKGSFFTWQVWSKPLPKGKVAVLILNTGVDVANVNVTWQELKTKYPSSLSCCTKEGAHA